MAIHTYSNTSFTIARVAIGLLLWLTGALVGGAAPIYMAIALGHGRSNASPRSLWLTESIRALLIAIVLIYIGLVVTNGIKLVKSKQYAILLPSSALLVLTGLGALLGVSITAQTNQVRAWVGAGYIGTAVAVMVASVAAWLQTRPVRRRDSSRDVT